MSSSTTDEIERFKQLANSYEQDQKYYEINFLYNSTINKNFLTKNDKEIIKLGRIILKNLKLLFKKSNEILKTLITNESITKFNEYYNFYLNYFFYKKNFYNITNLCMCFNICSSIFFSSNTSSNNNLLELNYLKIKLLANNFIFYLHTLLYETDLNIYTLQYYKYNEYNKKIIDIYNVLLKLNYKKRKNYFSFYQKKMLLILNDVDNFLLLFSSNFSTNEKLEAEKRVKQGIESLNFHENNGEGISSSTNTNSSYTPSSFSSSFHNITEDNDKNYFLLKKNFIKIHIQLQEILNSALIIIKNHCKINLNLLSDINKNLIKNKKKYLINNKKYEENFVNLSALDFYQHLQDENEIIYSETSSKIKEITQKWQNLSNLSNPYDLYDEKKISNSNTSSSSSSITATATNIATELDPTRLIQGMISGTNKLLSVFDSPSGASSSVTTSSSTAKETTTSNPLFPSSILSFNPLDSIMGSSESPSTPPPKKGRPKKKQSNQ